jgi:topoisomerase-4 subunit A
VVAEGAELKVVAGKRTLTMKATDMDSYLGVRDKRGGHLPRGFQRVDKLQGSE